MYSTQFKTVLSPSSTSESLERLGGSSLVVQLAQSEAFLRRVAELDAAYLSLLGSPFLEPSRLEELAGRYVSSLRRACEALLNGSSQEERLVFRSQLVPPGAALKDSTPTSPAT